MASRSSDWATSTDSPASRKIALADGTCAWLTSINSFPCVRSQAAASAAMRRCTSRPSAPPSSAPRFVLAGFGRHQRDGLARDVRSVGDEHVDVAAQPGGSGSNRSPR